MASATVVEIFVLRTLSLMASRLNEVQKIVAECFAPGSFGKLSEMDEEGGMGVSTEDNAVAASEWDLIMCIWEKTIDPNSLRTYRVVDRVVETAAAGKLIEGSWNVNKIWWRTGVAVRSLIQPAAREQVRQRQAIQHLVQSSEGQATGKDDANSNDVLTTLIETLCGTTQCCWRLSPKTPTRK